MNTLSTGIITVFFIASSMFITTPQHAYSSICAVKETTLTTPQFYRVSDSVFVGTIYSIKNYTDNQWKIQFNAEKIWKGGQYPTMTLMASSLQACGYSLTNGEKYLVFASGSPSYLIPQLTRPYADAQDFISLYDDPKFQTDEINKENLIKKLEAAKDSISNMVGSKITFGIPFNMVGVDELNAVLDIGIDSTKATLSIEEYQKKIKDIVGDIPMEISFGQIQGTPSKVDDNSRQNDSSSMRVVSPLKQFKSGIAADEVKCGSGLSLVTKAEDGSPACIKPTSAVLLILRGWALESPNHMLIYHMKANSTTQIIVKYSSRYVDEPTQLIPRIYDGKSQYQTPPSKMSAIVSSDSVPGNANVTVTYTITTHDTKGVYWFSLDVCSFVPVVVDLDNSKIAYSDLQSSILGYKCPGSSLQYKIVGFEGIDPEYVG